MTPLISALSKIRRSFRTWMMFFDEYLEPLWTALKRFVPEDCMCKIDAIAFHLRVHQRAAQIEPDDWKWNFSLLSLWYLRLFSLTEHNHCDWKSATTERAHTEVSKPPHEQPPSPHHPLYLLPLQLPPQNHRAAYDIEQSCHPRQPGSHYSGRIYPSMLRKSAFIRPFYRWRSRSLLGMDSISCAAVIKS